MHLFQRLETKASRQDKFDALMKEKEALEKELEAVKSQKSVCLVYIVRKMSIVLVFVLVIVLFIDQGPPERKRTPQEGAEGGQEEETVKTTG